MPLDDNLIYFHPLDEASGNAVDATGSVGMSESGTIGTGTGLMYSTARHLDPTEYFQTGDSASVSWGDIDATIGVWLKLDTKAADQLIIVKGGATWEYSLYYDTAVDRLRWNVFSASGWGGGTNVSASSFGAVPTATWMFVMCWHDATNNTISIQVNNGTVDSLSHSGGVWDGGFSLNYGDAANGIDGLMQGSFMSKRLFTADERTWLYNSGSGRTYASWASYGGVSGSPHYYNMQQSMLTRA